jgi:hypothetical protein
MKTLHHRSRGWMKAGKLALGQDANLDAAHIFPPPKQSFAQYGITKWNLVTREKNACRPDVRNAAHRRIPGAALDE